MEKLYECDPYLTRFTAAVQCCQPGAHGWDVVLDRTAFYPEGGGQPWDTGILGGRAVTQVHTCQNQVVHSCDGPLEEGAEVEGEIDWTRRFDLMQQHSGEHIVSGLAHAMYGCDNVGFHLGTDTVTIDLNVVLDQNQVQALEDAANRYLWTDPKICITFPAPQALESLEYRSKKALTGQVRIVSFPGADTCACCGTHVGSAGQIGLVKLLSCQGFRNGVRIELLCGQRALRHLSAHREQNRQISQALSAKPFETADAVRHMLEEVQGLKTRLAALEDARFAQIAAAYDGTGDVLHFEPSLSPDGLRRLTDAIAGHCGGLAACFSGSDDGGRPYALAQRGGDLRTLTQAMNAALHGRGGGKPDFVQGNVQATQAEICTFFAR